MEIEEIKKAVESARERQTYMTFPPDLLESDAALIALWEMTQIDESVFETAKTILSEPAYHSADAALLARAIMVMKEAADE